METKGKNLRELVKQKQEQEVLSQEESKPQNNEAMILESFNKNAGDYWGVVSNVHIYHNRTTGQGTEYFLIIADTNRNEVKGKLLQEWYVSKKNEARVNPKRTMWINDSLVDEVAEKLYD